MVSIRDYICTLRHNIRTRGQKLGDHIDVAAQHGRLERSTLIPWGKLAGELLLGKESDRRDIPATGSHEKRSQIPVALALVSDASAIEK